MFRSSLLVCVFVAACASGGTNPGERTDTGPSGTDVPRLDTSSACDPACRADESCVDGACISAGVDGDEDGLPIEVDCDDSNPLVGRTGSRTCSTECGDGVETCSEGLWGACSAECGCTAGATQMIPCGACGEQNQVCTAGRWENSGACSGEGLCPMGSSETRACEDGSPQVRMCGVTCTWGEWTDCAAPPECAAGEIERDSRACGSCGGMEERTRTCVSGFWGAWSGYGACSGGGGGECTMGETDTETGSCTGSCGTRSRSRTCGSDCRWGGFGAWSACSGGACTPDATRPCANGDSCGVERCTSSCTWAACAPASPGGCLRIRPGTSGPAGNNFQCCTPSGGGSGWQFCLSSCNWSTSCEPHSC